MTEREKRLVGVLAVLATACVLLLVVLAYNKAIVDLDGRIDLAAKELRTLSEHLATLKADPVEGKAMGSDITSLEARSADFTRHFADAKSSNLYELAARISKAYRDAGGKVDQIDMALKDQTVRLTVRISLEGALAMYAKLETEAYYLTLVRTTLEGIDGGASREVRVQLELAYAHLPT